MHPCISLARGIQGWKKRSTEITLVQTDSVASNSGGKRKARALGVFTNHQKHNRTTRFVASLSLSLSSSFVISVDSSHSIDLNLALFFFTLRHFPISSTAI
ncbi:hypothetical protein RJT34_19062 [Clitoria ternatea]|uniref:Uncharacterized protein n=1 Tax=Clitoria ternatea TaxID=43366 RepID=A0AAN9IQB9_CLITE